MVRGNDEGGSRMDEIKINVVEVIMRKQNTAKSKHYQSLIATCLFCVCALANVNAQTIYKTVHADGTVTYSDLPTPGAIEVNIKTPTNTMKSNPNTNILTPQINATPKVQYNLSVLSPADNATIRDNSGKVNIAAGIDPIANGVFQLNINGKTHESPNGVFSLTDMNRGAYEYSISFIDTSGKVIASTPSRNLYLHQASALIN